MPSSAAPSAVDATDRTPDFDIRLAFGLYVGSLALGAAPAGGVLAGRTAPGSLYLLALGGFLAGALAGWVAAGRPRRWPRRLGASPLRYGLFVPAGLLGCLGAAAGPLGWPSELVVVGFFAAVPALFAGAVVAMMARTRYVAARFDGAPAAEWRAKTAPAARRRRLAAALVAFGAAGVVMVADFVARTGYGSLAPGVGGIVGALVGSTIRSETFRAHGAGLEVVAPVNRRFVPWERFDGYEVTAEELRLRRRWWPDYRCDRAEIEDVEAATAAVERFLGD